MSGSSAQTFLPGFALSGKTHSLEGFANTFPADEEVSLLLLPLATGVEVEEVVLGRWTIGGRAGIAILPLGLLDDIEGRAFMDDDEAEADEVRAARFE